MTLGVAICFAAFHALHAFTYTRGVGGELRQPRLLALSRRFRRTADTTHLICQNILTGATSLSHKAGGTSSLSSGSEKKVWAEEDIAAFSVASSI